MSEDAFEKLAKLAGVSVESAGEGLPRTRAEAKAVGSAWYFTGKPCLLGHVAKRTTSQKQCCECELMRNRQRNSTSERKEYMRHRNVSQSKREYEHRRQLARTGDALLFSINQAELAARHGRATIDIIAECPSPQRGRLQALVERIRSDPQAGKAAVGLLQAMRGLRKAELAEMAQATETETEN